MNQPDRRPLVAFCVGTDHHRFDRLVDWADAVAAARPDVEVCIQYGHSRPPDCAHGQPFWDRQQLAAVMQRAHVVVSHGGPGLITEVRGYGTRPVVVPRDPERDEHVDGHQLRFAARLAADGLVDLVGSAVELENLLASRLVIERGAGVDVRRDRARVEASAKRFGSLVERLLARRR